MADEEILFDDVYMLEDIIGKWVHVLISIVIQGFPTFLESEPGACWIWENIIWIGNFDAV